MAQHRFPADFRWGAATAAYQIEGATAEDGRGPSIWDTFSHTLGKTLNGDTGDVACDHYHRWQEDVQLMQRLGLQAYRFSVAWPRVLPQGVGHVNERGLDFYDRLVDALLSADITPFITLYHWDLPQALQDRGGWSNPATVEAFVDYADAIVGRLGDRVQHWITHNEPWVVAFIGHLQGRHAPGVQDLATALQVAHNLLVSHGRVVPVLRAARAEAQVGITLNLALTEAASTTPEDQIAAQIAHGFLNRWFLDPVFGRGYPADMVGMVSTELPEIPEDDLATIATPIDFLGVNYYHPAIVRAVPTDQNPLGVDLASPEALAAAGYQVTAMGWPVVPSGLTELLSWLQGTYAPPAIYITENGAAYDDTVADGAVDDPRRINYLRTHIDAAQQAFAAGVPLRGYFVWSLIDNFEWAFGYSKRFGLIHVDYPTQRRIPKASFTWYQRVVAANGLVDGSPD